LRLSVSLESPAVGLSADIRLGAGDPGSSVTVTAKEFSEHGTCSLVVEDEDLEGKGAFLVVLDDNGNLVAQRAVTIGINQ
jgi:hypothetical protein